MQIQGIGIVSATVKCWEATEGGAELWGICSPSASTTPDSWLSMMTRSPRHGRGLRNKSSLSAGAPVSGSCWTSLFFGSCEGSARRKNHPNPSDA